MTRVDFYQLSRDPVERVVPLLAGKVLGAGERALVVAEDEDLRARLSTALWETPAPAFLGHGPADGADAARQPILVGSDCEAANAATMAIFADGRWREAAAGRFARVMLLFDSGATEGARQLWRAMDAREDIDNRIFKQDEAGRWREGR